MTSGLPPLGDEQRNTGSRSASDQRTSGSFGDEQRITGDVLSLGPAPHQREWDLFLETLRNVNEALRLHMTLAGGVILACITVLNVLPAPSGMEYLDMIDNFVFLPALASMVVAYFGIEKHWNYFKRKEAPPQDVLSAYEIVRYKYRMLHWAASLLAMCMMVAAVFILIEFKHR